MVYLGKKADRSVLEYKLSEESEGCDDDLNKI